MTEFRFLPLPTEDYEAWKAANGVPGITADTVLQTSLNERGDLVFHIVTGEEMEELVCNGDCEDCPVRSGDCGDDCFECPCFELCEDSPFNNFDGAEEVPV